MNTINKSLLLGTLTLALLLPTLAISQNMQKGYGGGKKGGGGAIIDTLPLQQVDEKEKAGLLLMREEEKLARDVYNALFQTWKQPVFSNIARSEQQHMDAVKRLLDRYGIADPINDDTPGIFKNPDLQQLYTSLVEQGSQSLSAALTVGATIEDLDIKDLLELLEATDNQDISRVYENLTKGSRNHLRSFGGQLTSLGTPYAAQYLDQAAVDAILNSPRERGPAK